MCIAKVVVEPSLIKFAFALNIYAVHSLCEATTNILHLTMSSYNTQCI